MRKAVWVKDIKVGGGGKVSLQSMTNTSTLDIKKTTAQINNLHTLGADIVRVSIPDKESADAFKKIVEHTNCPLVADIHYDYRLALLAIENGASKIRINPSNISQKGIIEIAKLAGERKVPIRVGVNQGSILEAVTPTVLASLALDSAKLLEDKGFFDIVLAVKSSSVKNTVMAYKALYNMCDYPLHIGLTESGTIGYGGVKSAVAIGALLLEGIGDTVRVSLSSSPENEVVLGKQILRATGLDNDFVEIISCPTCARTSGGIEVEKIAKELEKRVENIKKPIKIAVMGCTVNGIGESKGADFGVCGGRDKSIIFYKGEKLKTVDNQDIIPELLSLLENYNDGK